MGKQVKSSPDEAMACLLEADLKKLARKINTNVVSYGACPEESTIRWCLERLFSFSDVGSKILLLSPFVFGAFVSYLLKAPSGALLDRKLVYRGYPILRFTISGSLLYCICDYRFVQVEVNPTQESSDTELIMAGCGIGIDADFPADEKRMLLIRP